MDFAKGLILYIMFKTERLKIKQNNITMEIRSIRNAKCRRLKRTKLNEDFLFIQQNLNVKIGITKLLKFSVGYLVMKKLP